MYAQVPSVTSDEANLAWDTGVRAGHDAPGDAPSDFGPSYRGGTRGRWRGAARTCLWLRGLGVIACHPPYRAMPMRVAERS